MRKFYKSRIVSKKESVYILPEEQKNSIRESSYLGKKGYTVLKTAISVEELEFLKKDLYMAPVVFGTPGYGEPVDTAFPIYRENSNKIYLPRFYGIERYGFPSQCEIENGIDINVPFVKELRDYQTNVVNIFVENVKKSILNDETKSMQCGGGGIIQLPCGSGKTVLTLKIISELKKKTLIIVHKEFLMNQWIERIQEFLPSAKIGKIQAAVCDTDDKDIVIGMVQTLYSREYPQELYNQFGLTIVDEVHRISSEQFSKTLFRTITSYMLGISATVKRKDGLEKVLYSFIGKLLYSMERTQDDIVTVRAIQYTTKDTEFNEVEQDFRGNTKYSTMISKLCAFCPRSDFVVRVLADLILENPDNQIMILAHNRCLLTYLYDEIVSKKIATVGYYVGGMKEAALKETESKQIVVATYSMAAEALDIKTLSTLVMVTPKTDIVQSVGRILRMKHDNPIIVDIIDNHEVFKNQWRQRKTFYRKSNYRIYTIDSTDYTDMLQSFQDKPCKWKKAFEPKTSNKNTNETNCQDEEDCIQEPPVGKCLININGLV